MCIRDRHYTWREIVPGDQTINVGSIVTSPNEKYFRLMAGAPIDECLTRTAIRNLRMYANGFDTDKLKAFKAMPPEIPNEAIEYFRAAEASGKITEIEQSLGPEVAEEN